MKIFQVAAAALWTAIGQTEAKSTFTPARPPAAPLAVRSPYLNVWLNGRTDGGESGLLPGQWPRFWTEAVQGWQGFIRVDGKAYNWMGGSYPGTDLAEQTDQKYTSTKTKFVMNVGGKVELTASFLSPVFPEDQMRQSIPFAYLSLKVKSIDGRSHSVQIYSDVSGQFASGDSAAIIEWEHRNMNGLHSHRFWRRNQEQFNETNDQASWGNWYWTTKDQRGVSYRIGEDKAVRSQFIRDGHLNDSVDTQFRAINDRWPVFSFARDLGRMKDSVVTLFSIGITQDKSIQFRGQGRTQDLPSLWKDYFNTDAGLVDFFYHDYSYARQACNNLDNHIGADSVMAAGQDYLTITSLALRQFYGGIQLVGTKDKVKAFFKEIGSDGNVQTMGAIFPAFPAMVYLNPDLIKWTLEPLLEHQMSRHHRNKRAVHDLGRYPRAIGYDGGKEESVLTEGYSSMIVMMLSYAQMTDDDLWLADYWEILKWWADYLTGSVKMPANQPRADDFAGRVASQMNVAIKSIIALQAMSDISTRTGREKEGQFYSEIAHEQIKQWKAQNIKRRSYETKPSSTTTLPTLPTLPTPPTNLSTTTVSAIEYEEMSSYKLLYNMWGDRLLGLDVVPAEVYDVRSQQYARAMGEYGLALDGEHGGTVTKADWEIVVASLAAETAKEKLVRSVARWINETPTWRAMTDLYDTRDGGYPRNGTQFAARPVVGGLFAILALEEVRWTRVER